MQQLRDIVLRSCAGIIRKEMHEGIEWTVVPVTALVEGVIQAVNAPKPELVRAERFSIAPQGWDGRPIFVNHPMAGGRPVSGNSPNILKNAIGRIHNTRVDGKRLLMEAWLHPEKAKDVIRRCESGKPIEISTGALIVLEQVQGFHNGVAYDGAWDIIIPDHLAILEDGLKGACNQLMGCGIRAAHAYELVGEDGLRDLGGPGSGWTAEGGHVPGSQGGGGGGKPTGHMAAHSAHELAADALNSVANEKHAADDPDVQKALKAAFAATRATGAKPYSVSAARAYIKMAEKATGAERLKHYREAAKYFSTAAKDHKTAASWETKRSEGPKRAIGERNSMSWLRSLVEKLRGKNEEDLTPVERELAAVDAYGYNSDLTHLGEEDAELIQYTTMQQLLENCGSSYDDVEEIIDDLISAEENSATGADEVAEEEIETAQINAVRTHCMSMISSLSSIIDLCRTLNHADLMLMRAAIGKRHSQGDTAMIQTVHDHAVQLGADCAAMKTAQEGKSGTCGCGGHVASAASQGEDMATKAERITALMSSEHNPLKDQKALEASSEEGLKTLEAHVEKTKTAAAAAATAAAEKLAAEQRAATEAANQPKAKTKEEWMREAPEELRTLIADREAEIKAETTEIIAELKTLQKVFTEDELKTKSIKELRQLRTLVSDDEEEPAKSRVNYSGNRPRGGSDGKNEDYMSAPPPNGYRIALEKNQNGGKEKVN